MSKRGDQDYKSLNYSKKQTRPLTERPQRAARTVTSYAEEVVVITSDEESSSTASQGDRRDRLGSLDLDRLGSETESVSTVKSEEQWSPCTVRTKTDNLLSELADFQTHLPDTRLAREGETSLADVLKMMMQMSAKDKEDREKRDAREKEEREQRETE